MLYGVHAVKLNDNLYQAKHPQLALDLDLELLELFFFPDSSKKKL